MYQARTRQSRSNTSRSERPRTQPSRSHQPRKRFGQHFLRDQRIIQRIIAAIAPQPDQHLIEIGPGLGSLTIPILREMGHLEVIEVDRDIVPLLQDACRDIGDLVIYQKDILHFDLSVLAHDKRPLRIFGNLPYNISTPLLFHLLEFTRLISDMHFMLQKEVAERLAATPNKKSYSRLSVMTQYHYQVKQLFDVPPQAFRPAPRVDSRIVQLIPYKKLPYQAKDFVRFETIVKQAFSQRRKTLRNCLKYGLKETIADDVWEKVNIDPQKRAENLSVEDFVRLSNFS